MYTAETAEEWGTGQGVNGTGKRKRVKGAYVLDGAGRRVRAYLDRDGGYEAAKKWADYLNEHMP